MTLEITTVVKTLLSMYPLCLPVCLFYFSIHFCPSCIPFNAVDSLLSPCNLIRAWEKVTFLRQFPYHSLYQNSFFSITDQFSPPNNKYQQISFDREMKII